MFPPFPFVVLWPFVQNLYLATSKSLQNIWKNWLPFLWSSPVGLHSSHSLHTVLHSHIYFPHSFVYIQFYHISSHFPARVKTMLCFNTHYSLLFLTLHFLTDRVEYLFPEWQWKKTSMQWWKHVPFHSNCSLCWIVLPLFSNRTCISKLGNSHQSVWQNFRGFFSEGVHFSNASNIPLQNFPGVTAWFEGLSFKSLSSKKSIRNRRIKTDYLHSINQNKTTTNAFQNIAIIIFSRLINCWTSFLEHRLAILWALNKMFI